MDGARMKYMVHMGWVCGNTLERVGRTSVDIHILYVVQWCSEQSLQGNFPIIFELARAKDVAIADLLAFSSGSPLNGMLVSLV